MTLEAQSNRRTIEILETRLTRTVEFALMIEWEDGSTEFVSAVDPHHAAQMARSLYAHRPTWTVMRELPEWSYATPTGLPHCPTCDMPLTISGYCKRCGS